MIFKKKKKALWIHEVEGRKAEIVALAGGEEATAESVLEVLFGTRLNEYEDNQYFVYGYDDEDIKQKSWQRLNALWLVPLILVFVFPLQWISKGRVGIKENTKVGRLLVKLLGKD